MKLFDDYRRTVQVSCAAWGSGIVIVMGRVLELIPPQYVPLGTLSIGIGVASSLALGRMKLTTVMTKVLDTGLSRADELIWHMENCATCKRGDRCAWGRALIRATTKERHGDLPKEETTA